MNNCFKTKSLSYRFNLQTAQSPTSYNLAKFLLKRGWQATRFNWRAHFGEENLAFDLEASEQLEFKHLLAMLVADHCSLVMPLTYSINDYNWPEILNNLANNYYRQDSQMAEEISDLVWILKPSLLNNGQDIKIFQKLNQIEKHYLSTQRLGGEHVLQQYLTHPHLLRGHKYSIRMFVVLTNFDGAFLYPKGYFNVALTEYQPNDFSDLSAHLTNEHLKEPQVNTVQIPTEKFDWFEQVYPQIQTITQQVIQGLQQNNLAAFVCKKTPKLAIFGFDFMCDAQLRVWLLEANHGACFPINDPHPLQKYLYNDFWQAMITRFVMPIATGSLEREDDALFDRV